MKNLWQLKNKATWLLLTGILVLCAGFIITGCGIGTGPQFKVQDPDEGQCALDYTVCPSTGCGSGFSALAVASEDSLDNKPLTFEAWIKPKASVDGVVLSRADVKKGAQLQVRATSSPANSVFPRFEIRRVQSDGTSSVSYSVDGSFITINSLWNHIVGVLTNEDHSGVGGHAVCTGVDGDATDDPWHLDIYQGDTNTADTLIACAATHDGQVGDDTPAAAASADEPDGLTANPGIFSGIMDEARIWTVERSTTEIDACRNIELEQSGTCGFNESGDNMILYVNFNECEGHSVNDRTGTFSGGLEYPDGSGGFHEWDTGWTEDTPF